jgi:hypothetical protein
MSAPVGNSFWKARSSHGPNPHFRSPGALWSACCEYFEWVEANPLYEDKLVSFQGITKHEPVAKMRAMTIEGLCIFLDISTSTWREWRQSREDLSAVIAKTEEIIRCQKFTGAAADLLNPNIIARDLGLTDKTATEHDVTDKAAEAMKHMSDLDAARRVAFLLAKGAASDAG